MIQGFCTKVMSLIENKILTGDGEGLVSKLFVSSYLVGWGVLSDQLVMYIYIHVHCVYVFMHETLK